MRVFLLPLLSLLPCVIGSDAPAPTPMPYMVDQGGHGLYVDDTLGFSASRLVSYGVKQAVVSNSIDCSVTLAAVPGGPWYDASGLSYVKGSVAAAKQQLAIAHNAGLKFFMATDMFQFPDLLLAKYGSEMVDKAAHCGGYRRFKGGCISLTNFTRAVYSDVFDEIMQSVPGIDGFITRYGENSPCMEHSGNIPMDTTTTDTMISSLSSLLLFLREEACVKRNLTVIFRTWDTSTQYFHANPVFYEAVLESVPPHPKLVMSIKHTMLDFWRRVRFNPTLGVGKHNQLVEVEVGGMYGGCGSWPLYVGNAVIEHYEEDVPFGLAYGLNWLRTNSSVLAGVLTNHQCTDVPSVPAPWIWWRLEEEVVARWANSPGTPEASLFDAAVESQLGITDPGARALFRNLTLTAMSANLRMQTCQVFDETLQEVDRPTANWMLWNCWGGLQQLANDTCNAYNPAHCEVFPWLVNNTAVATALAEKQWSASAYAALNTTAAEIAHFIPNATLARVFLASVEAGAYASSIVSSGWTVMLLGYAGDRAGGVYNVSGIRAGVAAYDYAWEGYTGLSSKYGPAAPGLMNDSCWQHPEREIPGMRQSVALYRHI